jgi:hypothetical protein
VQLGILRERVESVIYEDLDTRKLFVKRFPKCLKKDENQRCQSPEQRSEIFRPHISKGIP